jgi:hypothetical protein
MSIVFWSLSQNIVRVLFLVLENILIGFLLINIKLDSFVIKSLASCKLNELILIIDRRWIINILLIYSPIWVEHWLVIFIRQKVVYSILYFYWFQFFFIFFLANDYFLTYWVDWIIVIFILGSLQGLRVYLLIFFCLSLFQYYCFTFLLNYYVSFSIMGSY